MKHDVKIVYEKEKNINTITNYYNPGLVMTKKEKEMMEERKRVEKLLSPTYYSNKNAIY